MSPEKITFINHACFLYEGPGVKVLFDPWFRGKVFNDSWHLLREDVTDLTSFSDVTHVCISHEHPDHLHFETLRDLLEVSDIQPTLIFPARANQYVRRSIEKLGYKTVFIERDGRPLETSESVSISYFGEGNGHDNTIVLSSGGKVIVNQNDHYTSDHNVAKIRDAHPEIDCLFTQFSLAGYYGNRTNPSEISSRGTDFHLNRLINYSKAFKPKVVVPFASYVYFCHEYNQYLNDHIVTPEMVQKSLTENNIPHQLPWFGDEIHFDPEKIAQANDVALPKLAELFNPSTFSINAPASKDIDDILETFNEGIKKAGLYRRLMIFRRFSSRLKKKENKRARINTFIYLEDIKAFIQWNILTNKVEQVESIQPDEVDLFASSDQFHFMLKFPFGADTFNIAACHILAGPNGRLLQTLLMRINRSHYV